MANKNKIKEKEYIGITGFKTAEEIEVASAAFREAGINKDTKLTGMYGFLVLEEQVKDFSLKGTRIPSLNALPGLINKVPEGMMPTIHYCSRSRDLNLDNLMTVMYHVNIFSDCKFLQLNLDWPSPKKVQKIKELMPDTYIILQLNPDLQATHSSVVKATSTYEGIVDKLLIDPSLGAGIPYDAKITSKIIMKIDADSSAFSYTVCGGLHDNNAYDRIIEMKTILKQEYHYRKAGIPFSVDAEGRLRTPNEKNLDPDKVTTYIKESARGLRERV
ncbi:MAG: hypothetical protein ACP5N2_01820 [Candidatus Nanoarchaeia archaeon]